MSKIIRSDFLCSVYRNWPIPKWMKTDVEPSGAFAIWLHLFIVQEGVCFAKWKVRPWNISSRGQSIKFRQCSASQTRLLLLIHQFPCFFYILGIHSFEMYGVVVQKWRLQTCFQNSTKKSYYDVWWLFACPFWDNSWQLHLLVQQQKGFLDVISSGFMVSKRKIYSVSRGVPK